MGTTVADISDWSSPESIVMVTAYDAVSGRVAEAADVDIVLVGDSLGNTVLGYDSTLPVELDEMASRTGAVSRSTTAPLVITDMPFLSFGVDAAESIENAGRMLKYEGADGVKLECGPHTVDLTERLVDLGIPVMAHLGLLPQHVNKIGGYREQGTDPAGEERIRELAVAHAEAGAFALVLEHIPESLAATVTESIDIPTIGIGAGSSCDGQVLVFTDVVGLSDSVPPFAASFGDAGGEMERAMRAYVESVRDGSFPE